MRTQNQFQIKTIIQLTDYNLRYKWNKWINNSEIHINID